MNDVRKFVHKLLFRTILKVAMFDDTLGSVEALVGPNSHRDVQKRQNIFQLLRCLVTPWGSAPRILISSLLILKGDFAATFRLSCELITINFTNSDQLIKGEDPIRGG